MSYWPFKTFSQEMVSQIYDRYHEGVFILDKDARIVYYNKKISFIDGYSEPEVLGRLFTDVYDLNEQTSVSLACLAAREPVTSALVYRTSQGAVVNVYCNSYPLFEDGALAGAFCFSLDYGLSSTALESLTRNYLDHPQTRERPLEASLTTSHTFAGLIGRSDSFLAAIEKAKVAAMHSLPIMLIGETGSGKELFAQAIHNRRPGRQSRFMPVNCAAIPETLLESLLFGTIKGAFTGALDKAGLFEVATGGSIFLDEINSMPLLLQSKLLRVLQEKRLSRVGSTREVKVDCQIISAASHNPYSEISAQRLRQDLFYRLGAIMIYIPPLRERPGDIRILSEHFIKKHRPAVQSRTRGLSHEALAWLEKRDWPGNVRELEHALTAAMIFAKNETYLKVENFRDLAHFMIPPAETPKSRARPVSSAGAERPDEEEERESLIAALEKTGGHKAAAAAIMGLSPQLLHAKLKKYGLGRQTPGGPAEKERIEAALEKTGGHKSAAAAILGMSRQLLHSKLKKHGLS